jgi:hypothetical protein
MFPSQIFRFLFNAEAGPAETDLAYAHKISTKFEFARFFVRIYRGIEPIVAIGMDLDWARKELGLLELSPVPVGKMVPFRFLELTRVQREVPEPVPHVQA